MFTEVRLNVNCGHEILLVGLLGGLRFLELREFLRLYILTNDQSISSFDGTGRRIFSFGKSWLDVCLVGVVILIGKVLFVLESLY